MQEFQFDLFQKTVAQTLNVKQGDVGRKFKAVITAGDAAYNIPAGTVFSVWYSGPAGMGNYSAIGTRSAVMVQENTVTVELIAQMLVHAGTGAMCLVMNGADGSQLGLWNIVYVVDPVPGMGSEAAEDYYTALSEVAEKAVKAAETFQTDTTLQVSGRAADAAATGAALEGKAPGMIMELAKAFGINTGAILDVPNDNFNTLTGNSIYKGLFGRTVGFPDGLGEWAFVMTLHYDDGGLFGKQIAWDMNGNTTAQRYKRNGAWNPWECENPPMVPGVEYRTTERWHGMPVYTKLIDCGAAVNEKRIETGINNVIRYSGLIADLPLPYFGGGGFDTGYAAWLEVNSGYVELHIKQFTEGQVYAQLWYVK